MTIDDNESYPVGPTHYSGWTCKGCSKLETFPFSNGNTVYKCLSTDVNNDKKLTQFVDDITHTPNWCPYLRGAIVHRTITEW